MNAVPNTNPDQKPDRARTPVQTRVRPATHTGSRYAQWYGSKESPAPIPARAAMTVRRGRLTLPPDHVRRCAGRVPGASNVRHRAERGMRAPRAGGSGAPRQGPDATRVRALRTDTVSAGCGDRGRCLLGAGLSFVSHPAEQHRPPGTASHPGSWYPTRSRGHLDVSTLRRPARWNGADTVAAALAVSTGR